MIKNKLKIRIVESGKTQKEIANRIKINENTISNWTKGKNLEQIYTFYLLCKELQIDIKDIFE